MHFLIEISPHVSSMSVAVAPSLKSRSRHRDTTLADAVSRCMSLASERTLHTTFPTIGKASARGHREYM